MKDTLKESFEEELKEAEKKKYNHIVKETKPKTPYFKNMLLAFLVGGAICALGQIILEIIKGLGVAEKDAITLTLVTIIFLGAMLTGFGIYDKLGKYAGAGSIVPISGFANSIVAPALEGKAEGYIQGLAAKMFTLAGPVIVYGICGSIALGLIKYFYWQLTGGF